MKSVDGAKARIDTPSSLVEAIPVTTELPIAFMAFMARSFLVPRCLRKFIPIWLQNSTPNPRLVMRLTTKTAFISIGYPPRTILSIHMHPISSKKTKKTQRAINKARVRLESIWRRTMMTPTPIATFWKHTPLMYVY